MKEQAVMSLSFSLLLNPLTYSVEVFATWDVPS